MSATAAEATLDAVAAAYADDPAVVERLLLDLAGAAAHADHMRTYHAATDHGRELAAAAHDAAREQLAAALDLPDSLGGSTP
ncbi:hypothetical protein PH213_16970 [Streptomyces sp. SRF1]|uniref:hypothetical protein n=1 Tax=Streptomyces sp. SRF1 TaxID=1549642 RepID=UPI0025B00F3D|nr:hypothetical protein [Streptomyces sp. SRF1]MDN3056208.1 hypothetical protein [Streptomyces sp. SRF1]